MARPERSGGRSVAEARRGANPPTRASERDVGVFMEQSRSDGRATGRMFYLWRGLPENCENPVESQNVGISSGNDEIPGLK